MEFQSDFCREVDFIRIGVQFKNGSFIQGRRLSEITEAEKLAALSLLERAGIRSDDIAEALELA